MIKLLIRLAALFGLLALAQLGTSCARRPTYWTGFHGPAYLPATPVDARRIHRLDSTTAHNWPPNPAFFRP